MKISTDRLLDLNQKDLESCAFAKEVLKKPGRKDRQPKTALNTPRKKTLLQFSRELPGGIDEATGCFTHAGKSPTMSLFIYMR